jgi:Rieske 2Fe-2S family protein
MTLPARYYTDPAIFRAELERLYFGRWIHAGRADRLTNPGDYFLSDVAGESVIVTRSADGALRAFFNVCRHRGTRMCTASEGAFDGRIRCPYHGWTYGLDGSLISAPNLEQPGFSRTDYPLHAVAVDTWEGHLFLNFATRPRPLSDQLGELIERFSAWRMHELKLQKRIVYDVKANWKLIVQNYNECLHCPMVHPALDPLTDYLGADNQAPTPDYIGGSMGFRSGVETMTFDGVRRRAYLPGLNEAQRQMVNYYAIYPNLLLGLHPDYMMIHTLWPKAVDHTEIVCEWHFHPDEIAKPGFVAEDAIEFWDQINREDWRISELSQLGISSRAYTPGPYSKREELLLAFDKTMVE